MSDVPEKPLKPGYYRFTSERSSRDSVCEYRKDHWWPTAEAGPVTLEELNRRGWDLGERIKGT